MCKDCKKQQDLRLDKISTRFFVFYITPPMCRKRRPPSKSLGNGWKLLSTTSRHLRSIRNNTAPDDFQLYKISALLKQGVGTRASVLTLCCLQFHQRANWTGVSLWTGGPKQVVDGHISGIDNFSMMIKENMNSVCEIRWIRIKRNGHLSKAVS